jgi:ketosteroid isomerase-like protein
MSQENVEIVRRALGYLDEGNFEALIELLDPDVEWIEDPRIPGAVTRHGTEEVRRYGESLSRYWESLDLRIERCVDRGADVVVFSTIRATARTSGVDLKRPIYTLVTVRDGKLVRARWLSSETEALEAAGLRE